MASTEVNENKKSEYKFNDKKEKPLTKVIVRRLPPTIDLKTFLDQVSPLPDNNYIYLAKGDNSLGKNCFARVYINFVCADDVYSFKERFDNYVFVDTKGHEYPAVVEYASFQKIPKKRNKSRIDPKCGSMELDPHYIEFLEVINKPKEPEKKAEFSLTLTNTNKNDLTTPLLEYIKNKRAERIRFREGRREERKKKELKKERENKKKVEDDKSPSKHVISKPKDSLESEVKENEPETTTEKTDVVAKSTKPSKYEKKYDNDKKEPRQKYKEKRDYKERDYKKYSDYRKEKNEKYEKEEKTFPKKIKKYSEKREERKMEAAKAEQKKIEEEKKSEKEKTKDTKPKNHSLTENAVEDDKKDINPKESSKEREKRIRNKDRPALTIYRPGMLSKRKQNDGEETK